MVPPVRGWFNTGTNPAAKRICLAKYHISQCLADPKLGEDVLRAAYAESYLHDGDFLERSTTSSERATSEWQSTTLSISSRCPTLTFPLALRVVKPAAVPPHSKTSSPHQLNPIAPSTSLEHQSDREYVDPIATYKRVLRTKKITRESDIYGVWNVDLGYKYSTPKEYSDAELLGDLKVMQSASNKDPKLVDWREEMEKSAEDEAREIKRTAVKARGKHGRTEKQPATSEAMVQAEKVEDTITVTRGGRRSRPTKRALGFD